MNGIENDPDGDASKNEIVRSIYRSLLNREADPSGILAYGKILNMNEPSSLEQVLNSIISSDEFRAAVKVKENLQDVPERLRKGVKNYANDDFVYFGGHQKKISSMFYGTCAISPMVEAAFRAGDSGLHQLWESRLHSEVGKIPPEIICDFALVSMTLRHILAYAANKIDGSHEDDLMWTRLATVDEAFIFVNYCKEIVKINFEKLIVNIGLAAPIIFMSIIEPTRNYLGSVLDPYDARDLRNIVRELNRYLYELTRTGIGTYFFEINDVLNMYGRMGVQDDVTAALSHASFMGEPVSWDADRIQSFKSDFDIHDSSSAMVLEFQDMLWAEIKSFWRIIVENNRIKLIIMDLDDSMWRGVAADQNRPHWELVEGWPLGLVESLLIFKARGGVLAICSKNDYESTIKRFDDIFQGKIKLSDFVSVKINFESKSRNIFNILNEINILPESALFIDDNPREIDEVRSVFPDIKVLSAEHLQWRRQILLAPQLQVPIITGESRARSDMIAAKISRDQGSSELNRHDWLMSLNLVQTYEIISSSNSVNFLRALELINKSNQFNTNGRRWVGEEMAGFFESGGFMLTASLRDKKINNGIISVALICGNEIIQQVMSCRVFGLGVELAMASKMVDLIFEKFDVVKASIVDTGKNFISHDYYKDLGFVFVDGFFLLNSRIIHPDYIS